MTHYDDPQVLDNLEAAYALGMNKTHAAHHAGIAQRTLVDWYERAEKGIEPFVGIIARMEAAKSDAVKTALQRLRDEDDWRAVERWLARTTWGGYKPDDVPQGISINADNIEAVEIETPNIDEWREIASEIGEIQHDDAGSA